MDSTTVAIYEQQAQRYQARRQPLSAPVAQALNTATPVGAVRLDAGCGPGWYGPHLGEPYVALDIARSMLELVPTYAPGALRVQADLAHLPFRRHSIGAAFANRSYLHVPKVDLPLALWDLHRVVAPGAGVRIAMIEGDYEGRQSDDDLAVGDASRFFALWPEASLVDVFTGAGFADLRVERMERSLVTAATRARTLADVVGPSMRLLIVGLNPSLYAADVGVGFARPGNRFWPALNAAGITGVNRDPMRLFRQHRIGMTDMVKRATSKADEVTKVEFRNGLERLDRLCVWLQPAAVCILGLTGYRAATDRAATTGWQTRSLGGCPVYVMPNPSGLNAHDTVESLARHLRIALAERQPSPGFLVDVVQTG